MELDEETRAALGGGGVWDEVADYFYAERLALRRYQVEAYRDDAAWERRRRRKSLAIWKEKNPGAASERREAVRLWQAENAVAMRAYKKRWREEHREQYLAAKRAAYARRMKDSEYREAQRQARADRGAVAKRYPQAGLPLPQRARAAAPVGNAGRFAAACASGPG